MPTTANLALPYPDESAPADVPIDLGKLAAAIDAYGLALATPGDLKLSAAIAAPGGWLVCDGRAVSRGTYAALFTAVGTSFGAGDGSTTFNLPDFRGRAPIGTGTGTGLTARTLGAHAGEESLSLSVGQIPAHGHPVQSARLTIDQDPSAAYTLINTPDSAGSGRYHLAPWSPGYSVLETAAQTTDNIGGGAAHDNMPPFVAVNVLIKT